MSGTSEPLLRVSRLVARARGSRRAQVLVVLTRMLLGFAFLPAGLKKLLDQPFTDPRNHGPFHDFLHAFRDTGVFYQFVGALQLVVAALLLTQRRAALGALLCAPVITAIAVFCWSTMVVPTAIVATLMWLATAALLLWDLHAWVGVLTVTPPALAAPNEREPIDLGVWSRAGALILLGYLALTALAGEVYRPRGVELDRPAFYVLLALPLVPVVAYFVEARRRTRAAGSGA